jgi:hypothetical protein
VRMSSAQSQHTTLTLHCRPALTWRRFT